jgi:SAM-dependent methyltransferase
VDDWDHPLTPVYYEAFCRAHSRYQEANDALVREAALEPGMRVLDVGAGTGRTAERALDGLGSRGSIVALEPSDAMRKAGIERVNDTRVRWVKHLPRPDESFDRILAGAMIWQLHPLEEWIVRLHGHLRPGGALAFNIPGAYLMEPDDPGGGSDPRLLALTERLADGWIDPESPGPTTTWDLDHSGVTAILERAGLEARAWTFRTRITQRAYADWLKIPVLTARLFVGMNPEERAARVDAALETCDGSSWKWERWHGWTARASDPKR